LIELTTKIVEKIFGFVSWLNGIAKSHGFGITKIDLKLPSIEIEIKNLIVVSVPIAKIKTPEINFEFKPDSTVPLKPASK